MTLKLLLFTYILGGLTFLPLLALAIFAIAWYTLPLADDTAQKDRAEQNRKAKAAARALDAANPVKITGDGAASATFAVLRRYDFQGALAAFKEASAAATQTDGAGDAPPTGESVSVYQSMYRTVFDRSRNAANPLHDTEDHTQQTANQKAKARGKVFYIVLRHGHLMLYDSHLQMEVRHVIGLAHYNISIHDGDSVSTSAIPEPDLFVKRTAIVLSPKSAAQPSGVLAHSSVPQKPFYLFCPTNIDKEEFYHALLSSTINPPLPRPLDPDCAIKMQSALHSSSLTPETRALNALIARVFLAVHRTPFLTAFVRSKIEKKIARIQKPAFIASITCHSLDLGDAAPVISNPRLKDLHIGGDTILSLDLKYNGGLNLTISAMAKLDLGQRFKTRMVSLVLAVVLQRLQGKMLVRIKPPPSNRIWFCFETMPEMEWKIEPVVSSRQITYAFILRAIETRIREAFAEGLVKPNWDDVPFFVTNDQVWRGGIWEHEGDEAATDEQEPADESSAKDALSARNEKTMSMPALPSSANAGADRTHTASSSGAQTPSQFDLSEPTSLKRRSVASLPAHAAQLAANLANSQSSSDRAATSYPSPNAVPRTVRSPSLTSPSRPVVALDDSSADAVRPDDGNVPPPRRRWIGRGSQQQTLKRDAVDAVRQVRDRVTLGMERESRESSADTARDGIKEERLSGAELEDSSDAGSLRRASESTPDSGVQTSERTTSSLSSSAVASLPRTSGRRGQGGQDKKSQPTEAVGSPASQQQRKTIMASTAAATAAARQWTWNAVSNRANRQQIWGRDGSSRQGSVASQASQASQESDGFVPQQSHSKRPSQSGPIGRGQPLPPPGVPLPGPQQKTLWNAAASLGGLKRKPALPPRRTNAVGAASAMTKSTPGEQSVVGEAEFAGRRSPERQGSANRTDEDNVQNGDAEEEGEFGPWMANDLELPEDRSDASADAPHAGSRPESSATQDERLEPEDEPVSPSSEPKEKKAPPPLPPRRRGKSKGNSDRPAPVASALVEHPRTLHSSAEAKQAHLADGSAQKDNGEFPSGQYPDDATQDRDNDSTQHTRLSASPRESPPDDLIDLGEDSEPTATADEGARVETSQRDASAARPADDPGDEVLAIPAPVNAEAEATGKLDLDGDGVDDIVSDPEAAATHTGEEMRGEHALGRAEEGKPTGEEETRAAHARLPAD